MRPLQLSVEVIQAAHDKVAAAEKQLSCKEKW
jgi:hypothetical protein